MCVGGGGGRGEGLRGSVCVCATAPHLSKTNNETSLKQRQLQP